MLLLGSKNNPGMDFLQFVDLYNQSAARVSMFDAEVYDAASFAGRVMMVGDELVQYAGSAPDNTDNNPVVEFSKYMDIKPNITIVGQLSDSRSEFCRVFHPCNLVSSQDSLVYLRATYQNEFYKQEMKQFVEAMSESRPSK